jgi:hypothetical protein
MIYCLCGPDHFLTHHPTAAAARALEGDMPANSARILELIAGNKAVDLVGTCRCPN